MITKTLNNKTFIFKDYEEPDYKEISYEGKTYKYKQGENQYGNKTYFYYGTTHNKYNKYLFFGPIIVETEPKLLFEIYGHIESEIFTKNEVRNNIKEKVDLINRRAEIKRGEII